MGPLLATAALLFCAVTARADEIRLVASNAVKELVHELIPTFEKSTGEHDLASWGAHPTSHDWWRTAATSISSSFRKPWLPTLKRGASC